MKRGAGDAALGVGGGGGGGGGDDGGGDDGGGDDADADAADAEYESFKVDELKEMLRQRSLVTSGVKAISARRTQARPLK
jgi:hypothetical protein